MRAIIAALAALGGGVILAAIAVSVATGNGPEVYWLLLGPDMSAQGNLRNGYRRQS